MPEFFLKRKPVFLPNTRKSFLWPSSAPVLWLCFRIFRGNSYSHNAPQPPSLTTREGLFELVFSRKMTFEDFACPAKLQWSWVPKGHLRVSSLYCSPKLDFGHVQILILFFFFTYGLISVWKNTS